MNQETLLNTGREILCMSTDTTSAPLLRCEVAWENVQDGGALLFISNEALVNHSDPDSAVITKVNSTTLNMCTGQSCSKELTYSPELFDNGVLLDLSKVEAEGSKIAIAEDFDEYDDYDYDYSEDEYS